MACGVPPGARYCPPLYAGRMSAHSDSARVESNDADSARVESNDADSARVESNDADSARVESNDADSARVESNDADSARVESNDADSARLDPVSPDARLDYAGSGLDEIDVTASPLSVLRQWYAEALADERIGEPAAMVVATVDSSGLPDARTVLLKSLDARGFVFYTNTESAKGAELAAHPRAAIVLPWHPMYRQVRARGEVEAMPADDAREYFQSRPRGSQVAAWASAQSHPLVERDQLLRQVDAIEQRFAGLDVLPLPDFWGGYRVLPVEIELWVGRQSRLHDRFVWTSADGRPAPLDEASRWRTGRRQP